jgi:hypothetical protein
LSTHDLELSTNRPPLADKIQLTLLNEIHQLSTGELPKEQTPNSENSGSDKSTYMENICFILCLRQFFNN